MATHSSAREREDTPHVIKSIKNVTSSTKKKTLNLNQTGKPTKNQTLDLNGTAKPKNNLKGMAKVNKGKTLNLNGTSRKRINGLSKTKTLNVNGATKSTKANALKRRNGKTKTTINNALRRRAQSIIKDRSIDAQSRVFIRYALEINDPWLAELVRRVDAGETVIYTVDSLKHPARRFKRMKD